MTTFDPRMADAGHARGRLRRRDEPSPPRSPGAHLRASPDGRSPRRRGRWATLLRVVALVVVVCAGAASVTAVAAVRTPGNQSFVSKWADWLRAHHAGFAVNQAEQWYYAAQAPPIGGRPRALDPVPAVAGAVRVARRLGPLRPVRPVALVTGPALPGEGAWQPTGPLVDGHAAMYEAQFRADRTYTSQLTTAVWIDPRALRVGLVPGAQEPGGTWPVRPDLTGARAARAVAAFNGGFRFQDARGGFELGGRIAVPLRPGAASMVLDDRGRVNVGAWGSEVRMGPHVHAVLQNLIPLVDGGRVTPAAASGASSIWGATLGANTVVARSGLGVTADGGLVYVAGPALTAATLASSLQRSGAVRAMSLDINPEWVTFNFFTHPSAPDRATAAVGTKLYPEMQRPSTRYLGPTAESRDFFTVSVP